MALYCRSLSLLRKWLTKGTEVPRWPRRPIVVSSSLAVVVPRARMSLIKFIQAMNLLLGREMMRRQKSRCHPRMIFLSSSPALAANLVLASISSCGVGSSECFGRAVVRMANRLAATHLARLLVPGMSTVREIMLSM